MVVSFEDATRAEGLRKQSGRKGELRIVTIDGLDRSACGGTHVRATGEIGPILIRRVDKVRGNVRLEFLCGMRAVRQSRVEYTALDAAARALSTLPKEVPALVTVTLERVKDADRSRRKLEAELFKLRGEALHRQTEPNEHGVRIAEIRIGKGPIGDDVRTQASAFAASGKAIYLAVCDDPGSILVAASADSGIHCGNTLKQVLTEFSGRGGGAATLAQGSFPGSEADAVCRKLRGALFAAK